MKRSETIEIAGRLITVSEIPVSRVYRMLTGAESILHLPLPVALDKIRELLPLAVESDLDELMMSADVFYDDMIALYEALKRTNPAFFELARALGLGDALAQIIKGRLQSFSSRYAPSSSEATE